ncbi:MAG: hypothetical protein RMJ75_05245 [Nitrososphaerota archaeon]|nr:hypothetical protein [Nitrososphaerota archaeon]
MRAIAVDELKRSVRLVPESGVDLINLYRSVERGDLVFAETTREIKKERASGEVDSKRIPLRIGIEVERKSADPSIRRISFLGRIVDAPGHEDLLKKHHTVHVERGREIEVVSRERFGRLLAISEVGKRKPVRPMLVVSADDERAALVLISDEGYVVLKTVETSSGPKYSGSERVSSWKEELVTGMKDAMLDAMERYNEPEVVVVAPQPLVDGLTSDLRRALSSRGEVLKRTVPASAGGIEGLMEVLRRGGLGKDLKPLYDALLVERSLELALEDPRSSAFGPAETLLMVRERKVGMVLVAEDHLWTNLNDPGLDEVLRGAESGKYRLRVVASGGMASDRVMALGGMIALDKALTSRLPIG